MEVLASFAGPFTPSAWLSLLYSTSTTKPFGRHLLQYVILFSRSNLIGEPPMGAWNKNRIGRLPAYFFPPCAKNMLDTRHYHRFAWASSCFNYGMLQCLQINSYAFPTVSLCSNYVQSKFTIMQSQLLFVTYSCHYICWNTSCVYSFKWMIFWRWKAMSLKMLGQQISYPCIKTTCIDVDDDDQCQI